MVPSAIWGVCVLVSVLGIGLWLPNPEPLQMSRLPYFIQMCSVNVDDLTFTILRDHMLVSTIY
jgi:hypothetical protein